MSKKSKDQQKVADLVIFCNEKDSQQYLVFDLKYGDNIIGKSSSKCSIVFRFTNEIDDVHTKISVDDDDYTIEDLGSQRGTFKIKSDNSLIRLKPNKSYDLSNNQIFYIGKYKCMFQIVKPGRAMAFSLSPSDLINSQKYNASSSTVANNTTAANNKKGGKKIQSIEDDIEDFTGQASKINSKKGQPSTTPSRLIINKIETENIDEEEEEDKQLNKSRLTSASAAAAAKKAANSQKNFVKSKGQLAKGIKGTFKNVVNDDDEVEIQAEDKYDITDQSLKKKVSDDDDDCDFQFSFPKSFKKNNQEETTSTVGTKKRGAANKKNSILESQQVEQHDEESMKLDSQFLKRIQEKLKNNTQINEQRQNILNELALKYSSQKNTQKQQSQDIPFGDDIKQPTLDKQESENYWQPTTVRGGNKNKVDSSLESQKNKKESKTSSTTSTKPEVESKVNGNSKKAQKEKETEKEEQNKKNSKQPVIQDTKETSGKGSKKTQKIEVKKDEKIEKLKKQAEEVVKTLSGSASKKNDADTKNKAEKKVKGSNSKKSNKKDFDDSTSISNDQSEDNDDDYDLKDEDEEDLTQSQAVKKLVVSTRKRKAEEMMTQQQPKEETKSKSKSDEKESKKVSKAEEPEKKLKTEKGKAKSKEETPKKQSTRKQAKKEIVQEDSMEEEEEEVEESKVTKTHKGKALKKDVISNSKDKKKEVPKEEEITTTRRSTRKAQVEETEKEVDNKKGGSTKKSVATKQTESTKKSAKNSAIKKGKAEPENKSEDEEMEIEEEKTVRKSTRRSATKSESNEKAGKQKVSKSSDKDNKKKDQKPEAKGKASKKETESKTKNQKNLIRRTKASINEVISLQQNAGHFMEIPRRNKYRIIFSNSTVTDEEKKEMSTYGVKILNDFHNANDFNILVTDEVKRRLKTLVALNKGYPIISQNWIKQCIKDDKIIPYEPFIFTKVDKALAKQHGFDLKKSINNQKEHPDGILHNLTFVCQNSFDSLGKEEIRKLVESAGGTFLYDKPKHTAAYFLSDSTKKEYNEQLNAENHIVLDIEGLFQTCLLQFNVLDNHIILAQEKKSSRKK